MNKQRGCGWILSDVGEFPVRQCGKPVSYTMAKDDDGRRVRKYPVFCEEHQIEADKQDADDKEVASYEIGGDADD